MNRATMTAILALGAAIMAGCGENHPAVGAPIAGGRRAVAILRDMNGAAVGRATATEVGGGLRVTLDVRGMPGGLHGVDIHGVGACDAPGFTTTAGRWAPKMRHGNGLDPAGPHRSDLPDLVVGRDGRGTLGVLIADATMAGLLDADGASLIVHAGPDNPMADSVGNHDGRIACEIFVAG